MTKDGMIYPVTLHIAKAKDGRNILYDVNVKTKEGVAIDTIATSSLAEELTRQAVKVATPSDGGSITQDGEKVKAQFSLSEYAAEEKEARNDLELELFAGMLN